MTTTPIRLLVHGARGKMGARIASLARDDARFLVVAAVDRDDAAHCDSLSRGSVGVIIDFSTDDGAAHAAALAERLGAALVVGTTGLSAQTQKTLEITAKSVAVMVAANTSPGVAVLNHLIAEAARLLGPAFDIDITEMHHTMKRDAPSGTALRLVETLREKAGVTLDPGRVHSIRAGEIIGDHSVQFAGPGERIKIIHEAANRDLFARGALRAAAWLALRGPGRHTIEQSLGL